jgi:glycerol 3-phosphatase-2
VFVTTLADGSPAALAGQFDTALLDLDGVVYIGANAIEGVPETLTEARRQGMRTAFVTNNASRTPEAVAAHLRDLGVDAQPDDVVTSAQAAATLVLGQVGAGAAVLVVGGEGLRAALLERGLRLVTSADDAEAVVQGFAPDVDWKALAEGTFAVRRGLPWIASNLDSTVPTARGIAPGNGALVAVIAQTTGTSPLAVAGKPERALHEESMRRSGAQNPLVVGDRLDTDIEGANRAGVPSLLVLTGVATPADVVRARPVHRPTYVAADLRAGLLEVHPPVTRDARGWTCGAATITPDGTLAAPSPDAGTPGSDAPSLDTGTPGSDAPSLDTEARGIDILRAACVAAWSGELTPAAVEALATAVPTTP